MKTAIKGNLSNRNKEISDIFCKDKILKHKNKIEFPEKPQVRTSRSS